jgi:myo-inositol-1(or 4)-monophosphatase
MSRMPAAPEASAELLRYDWLGLSRRAGDGLRRVLVEHPSSRERTIETGRRGEGGDRTLVIDAAAEDAVFAELEAVHREGASFTAISEERGIVDFGSGGAPPLVVVDPIDGSMNAKRGLPHHALSIAVADGATMADVVFGYVLDLGPEEEWHAVRGGGAFLDGEPLPEPPPERRRPDGRLELVAVESADPRWFAAASDALVEVTGRVRVIGSIAISLCQVAATRVDGMATLWRCRAVDAAAAQLVVRESGGLVAFTEGASHVPDGTGTGDPLGAPLDLVPRSPVVAARTARALDELATLPST